MVLMELITGKSSRAVAVMVTTDDAWIRVRVCVLRCASRACSAWSECLGVCVSGCVCLTLACRIFRRMPTSAPASGRARC
jgi:hypothetical protein